MYIVDFFKRMGRKANIPVIIYLIINVFVIGFAIALMFGLQYWVALLIGIVLYAISLVIALSPAGEWLLRQQTGCKEMTDPQQVEFLNPLFREVYAKAKEADPSISDDVKMFISEDGEPNAFATGRKTLCITAGMMKMPADQIKATLGHEFGHLAHKDTDLILVVSVGNLIVNACITIFRVLIEIAHFILNLAGNIWGGDEGWLVSAASSLYRVCMTAIIGGLTWLWTKLGVLLVMKSSRDNEFEADAFSSDLGYGNELCAMLDTIVPTSGRKGLFANLASSHPGKEDRIAKLQAKGATYMTPYHQ